MLGMSDSVIGKCNYDLDMMRRKTPNPTYGDEILDIYYKGIPAGKLM